MGGLLSVRQEGGIMLSPTSRSSLLNYIGIFILLAGMGVGEFIYLRSLQGGSGTDDAYPLLSQYDSTLVAVARPSQIRL